MSSKKEKSPCRSRVAWLFVLAFSLLLNARAENLTPEEQAAERRGQTPEQFHASVKLGETLAREFSVALKSSGGASQIQDTLKKAITNIDAGGTPITTNGNNLPVSFTDLFFKKPPTTSNTPEISPIIEVMQSGFMGLTPDNFLDQYTLMFAGDLMNIAPGVWLPVLQERAKISPPTVADYIIYSSVYGSLEDNNYDLFGPNGQNASAGNISQVPLSRSAGLLTLAQAKNPIYRLLAAKAAEKVEPDKNKRVNFYSAYLNETDPYILGAAVDGLARTQTPAAASVLQSLEPAVRKTGDTKLAAHLQEQIQRLSK